MPTPKVSPTDILVSHTISLSNGKTEIGLPIEGGVSGIIERPRQSSTIHVAGGRSKFGDYGAGMAQIGQETWIGGWGLLKFYQDPTRFFDSYMAYTMADGKLFPSMQWRYAEGHRNTDNKMPGAWKNGITNNVKWISLASNWYANKFTASASYNAEKIEVWVRKVGSPSGSLTVALYSDSGGEPNAELQSTTVSESSVDDYFSQMYRVTITSQALTAGTVYHIVVYDTSGGSTNAHWEAAYGTGSSDQAYYSDDSGSTWTATNDQIFFRVTEASNQQRHYFFEFKGALYMISSFRNTATASKLYINGDKGKATAATATTISDTNKTWTTDEWIGSWVKIVAGAGSGQAREITDNTGTQLTVDSSWDVTPTTTSQYVIYSTDKWTDISPSSGDQFDSSVTGKPLVTDNVVYFPRGNGTAIIKMRYNSSASPPAHEFRDEADATPADADVIYGFTDTTNAYQIFCANNNDVVVSRYASVAYASDLTGETNISVGEASFDIINMYDYNNFLYVFKTDGLYRVASDKAVKEDIGLDFFKSDNTGEAVMNRNFYMYFSWAGFSLQQMQKNAASIDLASVGPNQGEGLPSDRTGKISCLGFHPAGLFAGVDGGKNNYSSVLVRTDPVGWHEIYRAPMVNLRVRDIYFQDCQDTYPRLWIDIGTDVVFQEWPRNTFNPLKDSGVYYQHECSLTMADIDMGAPTLPKALKKFKIVSDNLDDGIYVTLDYQTDNNIGGSAWVTKGIAARSPAEEITLNLGNIQKARFRMRLRTDTATTAPIVYATVVEGFARTPVKYDWSFRVRLSSLGYTTLGTQETPPQEVRDFLRQAASDGDVLYMRSKIKDLNDKWVIVEPFVSVPRYKENVTQFEGYDLELTLREY